jgi:hypothetical protein
MAPRDPQAADHLGVEGSASSPSETAYWGGVLLLFSMVAITVAIFAPLVVARILYLRWVETERRSLAAAVERYGSPGDRTDAA